MKIHLHTSLTVSSSTRSSRKKTHCQRRQSHSRQQRQRRRRKKHHSSEFGTRTRTTTITITTTRNTSPTKTPPHRHPRHRHLRPQPPHPLESRILRTPSRRQLPPHPTDRLRHPRHVHGLPRPRGPTARVARSHAPKSSHTTPLRSLLAGPRRARDRFASGHGRCAIDIDAERTPRRRRDCFYSAGFGFTGCRARSGHVGEGGSADFGAGAEYEYVCVCELWTCGRDFWSGWYVLLFFLFFLSRSFSLSLSLFFHFFFLTLRIGAKNKCEELGIPFLGDVPLHPDICSSADVGKPTMASSPDSPQAQAFVKLASTIASKLQL